MNPSGPSARRRLYFRRLRTDTEAVGILMMLNSYLGIRRRADIPPFREWLRRAKPWELLLAVGLIALNVGALLGPWLATGSVLAGVLGFLVFGVAWYVAAIPLIVVFALRRGSEPIGTYWDGSSWRYGAVRR